MGLGGLVGWLIGVLSRRACLNRHHRNAGAEGGQKKKKEKEKRKRKKKKKKKKEKKKKTKEIKSQKKIKYLLGSTLCPKYWQYISL